MTDETGVTAIVTVSDITYTWDGKPLTVKDAKQKSTTCSYNKRGFLTSTTNLVNGITAYYYDIAGRKVAEVSPKNYNGSKTLDQMK